MNKIKVQFAFLCFVFCIIMIKGKSVTFDKAVSSIKKLSSSIESINDRVAVLEEKLNHLPELTPCNNSQVDAIKPKQNATFVDTIVNRPDGNSANQVNSNINPQSSNNSTVITQHYARPENCKQILRNGNKENGIYTIQPKLSPRKFEVFCDLKTEGGGWAVILNRFNGELAFDRDWQDYKTGFGNLESEFWLGLDYIHYLTCYDTINKCDYSGETELLIVLNSYDDRETIMKYDDFTVLNEEFNYKIHALEYFHSDGTLQNQMYLCRGQEFSTRDNMHGYWAELHDRHDDECKNETYLGGWWFNECKDFKGYLTGIYYRFEDVESESAKRYPGMIWKTFSAESLKAAKMMVR